MLLSLTPYAEKVIGFSSIGFDITGQLLIIYSSCVEYWRKIRRKRGSASYIYKLQESA